jgi:hypothetical protein
MPCRESIAVELSQRLSVREKPRFHGLNHKKHTMVAQRREVPVVTPAKMSNRVSLDNWGFRVNEKYKSVPWSRITHGCFKPHECLVTTTTDDHPGSATFRCDFSKVLREPFAAFWTGLCSFSSPFDIDFHSHQRLPPISPLAQRFPSE